MYTANRGTRDRAIRCAQWLTADRIIRYSCIMLTPFAAPLIVWGIVTDGFTSNAIARPTADFPVFWTASHLVLQGRAASAYDTSSFVQAEFAHFGAHLQNRPLPWLYPPTMLLFIAPVALVPFLPDHFLFFAGSLLCYAFAVSRLSGRHTPLPAPRAAVLTVATLPTTPHPWNDELTWLGIALFCLIAHGLDEGWLPGDHGILVLAWLLPIFEMLNRLMKLPQIGPVVLLAVLFVVVRRTALASRSAR
ncbi:DUF2029 domain-containing protein [Burkholderia metallica]|uniref:DUF2029 domain-containing protein n=1 Tax=Burkholderia metallica TaxID=488729 RepID=UPI0015761B12|nr:DUF2029 domain-containing protein [Burkholderia metallica]NTZ09219.1 DUF2029 domain-containing protein [Burkholderia metallica]